MVALEVSLVPMLVTRILSLTLLCSASGVVSGQSASVLNGTSGARAAGLGESYVLSSAESDAIFHHPGLLDAARGIALSRVWLGSQSALHSVSGAGEWYRGGLGFGLQALTSPSHNVQAASVAYARSLFGVRIGVVAKVVEQSSGNEREAYGAADIGIARALGPIVLGLTGRNLGPDPSFDSGDARLPTAVTLGAAARSQAIGPLDVILAARGTWLRDTTASVGAGMEVAYWPITGRTFIARVGFSHIDESVLSPLTLGAGFTGDRLSIDYAYQAGDLDSSVDVHRVTLRWR
jgi:hypothetical protein